MPSPRSPGAAPVREALPQLGGHRAIAAAFGKLWRDGLVLNRDLPRMSLWSPKDRGRKLAEEEGLIPEAKTCPDCGNSYRMEQCVPCFGKSLKGLE